MLNGSGGDLMLSLGELKASNEMPNACKGAAEGCK
jgi:hypothetical protein